jgi:hypothetical protein
LEISHWLTAPSQEELRNENLKQREKEMNDTFWEDNFVPYLLSLPPDDNNNYSVLMKKHNGHRSRTYPGYKSKFFAEQIFSSVCVVNIFSLIQY